MRLRVLSSVLVALAGAVIIVVSLEARAADARLQSLRAAAVDGIPQRSAESSEGAYLAALAAFANDRKKAGVKRIGDRAVSIASAEQAVGAALAFDQPTTQRSQLENLSGVLELEQAGLGGRGAVGHLRSAGRWLQNAVLDDETNADAKFNLELLISKDPQSAKRQQPQSHPASGKSGKHTRKGSPSSKQNSAKARELGAGF